MVIIGNKITIFHPLSQQIKKKSAIFCVTRKNWFDSRKIHQKVLFKLNDLYLSVLF